MTRLYIVRHCEARGNIDRIFQGHTDADISEKGKKQLEYLSERFKHIALDAVYSSPLKRAYMTAEAVNQYHGLPIMIEDDLIEINGGKLEGMPWAKFPENFPEMAKSWSLSPHEFSAPDGETMRDVFERVWKAAYGIAKQEKGKTVAIASHGCSIRNLLCKANGLPIERLDEVEWCDNTAVSIIDFDDDLNPTVVCENDTSHFVEGMSTLASQSWWKKENLMNLKFE